MGSKWGKTLVPHFSDLKDPRIDRTKRHPLMDILVMAIGAVICGADTWVDIESYGQEKYEWLKQFLPLPHGKAGWSNAYLLQVLFGKEN